MKVKNLVLNVVIFISTFILVFILFAKINPQVSYAEGTYANIGTSYGTTAGSDAVSWSQGNPITIDKYGDYIVPIENNTGLYKLAVSSNKGSSWTQMDGASLSFRPTMAYDSINDKLHVIVNTNIHITYLRYTIVRNLDYTINSFILDTSLILDSINSCTAIDSAAYPIILFKNSGTNGIITAFWSVNKTCSGVSTSQNVATMRVLSNDSNDGVAANWKALNGTTDGSTANVDYNILYSYNGTPSKSFIQSALIRGGSGAKSNDIYFFNYDENGKYGFRRLGWNSGSNNWSGTWTTRTLVTGDLGNSSGYGNKDELITKPVYNPSDGNVYVGIARWLNPTQGDTQSLYKVDSSDNTSLVGDIYSANGAAWFAPTLDITYNSVDSSIYIFYQTSSVDPNNSSSTNSSFDGHVYYKSYNGSTFSSAQAFFTQTGYSVDIPIVYQSDYDGRLVLFFRVDGAETPFIPPHNIYSGYVTVGNSALKSQSITSPYSATTYSDFQSLCDTKTNTSYKNDNGGEIALNSTFRDDFEVPISPYKNFFSTWRSGTYGASTFYPTLSDGTAKIYSSPDGAFAVTQNTFNQKTIEFRAKFTQNSFQHIGFASDEGFSSYRMFSTRNQAGTPGQLFARDSDSGDVDLGTGFLGSYHIYKIDWNATDTKYYIDGNLVATTSTTSTPMRIILSNNDTSVSSDLRVDWIRTIEYQTSGNYISCLLDSSAANSVWGNLNFNTTIPSGTVQVQTRTSNDGTTWSAFSSALNNGDTIPSPAGRYIQYKVTFTGDGISTPSLDNISISYSPAATTAVTTTTTSTTAATTITTTSTTAIPANSSIFVNNILISNQNIPTITINKPTISGVDTNAYKVVIASNTPQTFYVTPDGSGNWNVSSIQALSDGTHTITIYNSSGNVLSTASFIVNTGALTNTGQSIIFSIIAGILLLTILAIINRKSLLNKLFSKNN